MPEFESVAAHLSAELARAVGGLAVVCLGCPLAGEPEIVPVLTVLPPPFVSLPLARGGLLLVVFRATARDPDAVAGCASAEVAEVWLLQADEEYLEVLTQPAAGRYRRRALILPGESLALTALAAVRVTPLPVGRGHRRPNQP